MAEPVFNPPRGTIPVLQYLLPAQLAIDPAYQRCVAVEASRKLIAAIARDWDWSRCLPLTVARRPASSASGGGLFVVDGQHRLSAANLRGDIQVLPCVIVDVAGPEEEARLFVRLNKERRPIGKLDEFRAALAAGDPVAAEIDAALGAAGLALARHSNVAAWKPGELGNITGIIAAWRAHGGFAAGTALEVLAQAFRGEVLNYAGSIYPGVVAAISDPAAEEPVTAFENGAELAQLLRSRSQADWRRAILLACAQSPGLSPRAAAINVITEAWDEVLGELLTGEFEEVA